MLRASRKRWGRGGRYRERNEEMDSEDMATQDNDIEKLVWP
jgi:hypothetical protein